jgi:hypothetical protein
MSLLVGVFHSVAHIPNSTGRVHRSEVTKPLLGIKIQFIKMGMISGLAMLHDPLTEQILLLMKISQMRLMTT